MLGVFICVALYGCGEAKVEETISADMMQTISEEISWQRQYDLGLRYLLDGSYEEAIFAFQLAIQLEPKRPEPYICLADLYDRQGNMEQVYSILEEGYQVTGDQMLQEKIVQYEWQKHLSQLTEYEVNTVNQLYAFMNVGDYTGLCALIWPDPSKWEIAFDLRAFYNDSLGIETLYDGNQWISGDTGTGLIIKEDALLYGTFEQGIPQGECTLICGLSGGGQPTSYCLVKGHFVDGQLDGAGQVTTVYQDYSGNYNAQSHYCSNWVDDVAVGEIIYTIYTGDKDAPSIYSYSTNDDGTYNFNDPRFVESSSGKSYTVEAQDGSTYSVFVGEDYEDGIYNWYCWSDGWFQGME